MSENQDRNKKTLRDKIEALPAELKIGAAVTMIAGLASTTSVTSDLLKHLPQPQANRINISKVEDSTAQPGILDAINKLQIAEQTSFYNKNADAIQSLLNNLTWEEKVQSSTDGGGSKFKTPGYFYGKSGYQLNKGYSLSEEEKSLLNKIIKLGMGPKDFQKLEEDRRYLLQIGHSANDARDSGKPLSELNRTVPKLKLETDKPTPNDG
jgi:hypothetical protein